MSLQIYYVFTLPGKTKNSTTTTDRLLQCVLMNWLFQTFAESRSFNVHFFSHLLEKFFRRSSGRKSFTFLRRVFIKNLSSKLIWLILTCTLKLNCHSNDVIKLLSKQIARCCGIFIPVSIYAKIIKSRLRIMRVIVENKMTPFSGQRVVVTFLKTLTNAKQQ